ncbi:type VI secretion IcmF C-terminal domain-containing protein [Paraburkholderia bonniea]|uniref:type VI secretion IcmF C-terminal domain-containing protein n=1 Tax=Paraburkholderia bonniea TaxID=2152891 RepID=UPI003305866E
MPINLSAAGTPGRYPSRLPHLISWFVVWAACCGAGIVITLLLWPPGKSTQSAWFGFCIAGVPNLVFLLLIGIARAGYETQYLHALHWNQHRREWLRRQVKRARQPLYVLACSSYLPLDGKGLAQAVMEAKPLLRAQPPRTGIGLIEHLRLPDIVPIAISGEEDAFDAADKDIEANGDAGTKGLDGIDHIIEQVLAPLADTLHALCQPGVKYLPVVRLLTVIRSAENEPRLQQVRHALACLGLPPFECKVAAAAEDLMLADTWLDAREPGPLLVMALEWHDATPPSGSTEGGVAVLLGAQAAVGPVTAVGTLHRPVACSLDNLGGNLRMAMLWGKAVAAKIHTVWVSGFDVRDDIALAHAFDDASLTNIANPTRTVLQPAQASLNDAWQQTIGITWQRAFAGRYPFAGTPNDASVAELTRFLRRDGGLIPAFLGTQLAGVLELQGDRWVPVARDSQALAFDPAFLRAVNTLQRLAGPLLASGEAHYRFELKPVPTPGITDTVLTLDGQKLHYYNQRETWQTMAWPSNDPQATGTRLQWQTAQAGTNKHFEFSGRWGLIRMLEQAEVEPLDGALTQLTWQARPDTWDTKLASSGVETSATQQQAEQANEPDPQSLTAHGPRAAAPEVLTYPVRYQMRTEAGQGPLELLALRGFVLPQRIFIEPGGKAPAGTRQTARSNTRPPSPPLSQAALEAARHAVVPLPE